MGTTAFSGFPVEAFEFYDGLESDNTKVYWQANKAAFETCVRAPMLALCDELGGDFHLFRPYNDMRFAKDRPPYKVHQGAYRETEGGSGEYLHVGAEGLLVGIGYYSMAKDQLERYRAAVDDERTGREVVAVTGDLQAAGYSVGSMDELKSAPRGYPKDHPRIALLRRKGLMVSRSWPVVGWMHTAKAAAKVRETWAAATPLCRWLDANVGPSTLPPEDAWRG